MLTQDELKTLFKYHPDTGIFTYRIWPRELFKSDRKYDLWVDKHAGTKAGYRNTSRSGVTYIDIVINGKSYAAHRLAYLFITGEWPKVLDHINGDGSDNRWCNLRNADALINSRNKSRQVDNTSGYTGVYWHKRDKKWQAQIWINTKIKHLGTFDTKLEAAEARKKAEREYGFHENHGREKAIST